MAVDRPEQRPIGDCRRIEPCHHGTDGFEPGACEDGNHLALAFLIGLGSADRHSQSGLGRLQIGNGERGQFRAPERAGEAEQQEDTVAVAPQRVGAAGDHVGDDAVGGRGLTGLSCAFGAPNALHGGPDRLKVGRQRIDALEGMCIADGG